MATPVTGTAAADAARGTGTAVVARERAAAVAAAMEDIHRLVAAAPLSRELLGDVRARMLQLAARRELFPTEDFPPPTTGDPTGSCLYRLAQDVDDRFALYLNACRDRTDTPPHDHTTWAVVVGFAGEERNRFYRRTDGVERGVEETHDQVVRAGTGVTMLPDDLHSIHIRGGGLNFHLYGLALERLDDRRYFRAEDATWQPFPAHPDIREARGGVPERTGTAPT